MVATMSAGPNERAGPRARPAQEGPQPLRVLYVDDDQRARELFQAQVEGQYEVDLAANAAEGLQVLQRDGPFPIVVSDLRMIGMDGTAFLSRVKERSPDSVRVLLTGQADLVSAIAAVNDGHIFRFLQKPAAKAYLLKGLDAAAEQYRLLMARRVVLEQTLEASVKALTDVLALASPAAFGRATRGKEHVARLLDHFQVAERWEVEIGALLSPIGCVSLPADTALKIYQGQALTPEERAMAERLPEVAASIVAGIPNMEGVAQILRYQDKRFDGSGPPKDRVYGRKIPWGARALKLALDYDALEAQGLDAQKALDVMRSRKGVYDAQMLAAFGKGLGAEKQQEAIQELTLREVMAGMVFAEDVRTRSGSLLIARGQEVTLSLSERIKNLAAGSGVLEPVKVLMRGTPPSPGRRVA